MTGLRGDVLTSVVNKTDPSHDSVVHMCSQTRGVNRDFRDAVRHAEQTVAWTADIRRRAQEFRCAIEPGGDVTQVEAGYENSGIEELLCLQTYDALAVRMREFFADEITQGRILSRLSRDLHSPTPFDETLHEIANDRRLRALRSGLVRPIAQAIRYYKKNLQIQESGLVVLAYVYSLEHQHLYALTSMNLSLYVVNTIVFSMQNNLTNNNMLCAAATILVRVLRDSPNLNYGKETLTPEKQIRFMRCVMTAPNGASKNVLELLAVMIQHNNPDISYMDNCLDAIFHSHTILKTLLEHGTVVPFNTLAVMPSLLSRITCDVLRSSTTRVVLYLIKWSFTNHFETLRVDESVILHEMLQVLVNHIIPHRRYEWYYHTVMLLVSAIMYHMEEMLQHLPAKWVEFQDFVYDTGIVSVYLMCIQRGNASGKFQESVAAYVSVVTRLCRNNCRIRASVRRNQIVKILDSSLNTVHRGDELQTNRAALNAELLLP